MQQALNMYCSHSVYNDGQKCKDHRSTGIISHIVSSVPKMYPLECKGGWNIRQPKMPNP